MLRSATGGIRTGATCSDVVCVGMPNGDREVLLSAPVGARGQIHPPGTETPVICNCLRTKTR